MNQQIKAIALYCLLSKICFAISLNNLAIKYDTDKSSKCHNYTEIYEQYFNKYINEEINFLEIGFYKGASAKMWHDYFKKANLFFIDINPEFYTTFLNSKLTRSKFAIVDQENQNQLLDFANNMKCKFDIIIDDGSHSMKAQISSFITLFPYLKNNGIYVIEDMHTSYWKDLGGEKTGGQGTAIHFFKQLVDSVNKCGAESGIANKKICPDEIWQKFNNFEKEIKSIHFYTSLCIIIKDTIQ